MKTKPLCLSVFVIFIFLFCSCENENIEERTFEQDLDILYHFVCIDREGVKYYLAFGKNNDHLDLIPQKIIDELEKISATSLIRFYEELEYLNKQILEDSQYVDVVVLSTLYDKYEYKVKR